jgi:hypothetical protein
LGVSSICRGDRIFSPLYLYHSAIALFIPKHNQNAICAEVLDFLKFLKAKYRQETLEVSLLSKSSLQKEKGLVTSRGG